MKNIVFTLLGFDVPLWLVISVGFGLVYLSFSLLSAFRQKRLKSKRGQSNAQYNI